MLENTPAFNRLELSTPQPLASTSPHASECESNSITYSNTHKQETKGHKQASALASPFIGLHRSNNMTFVGDSMCSNTLSEILHEIGNTGGIHGGGLVQQPKAAIANLSITQVQRAMKLKELTNPFKLRGKANSKLTNYSNSSSKLGEYNETGSPKPSRISHLKNQSSQEFKNHAKNPPHNSNHLASNFTSQSSFSKYLKPVTVQQDSYSTMQKSHTDTSPRKAVVSPLRSPDRFDKLKEWMQAYSDKTSKNQYQSNFKPSRNNI